jgi:hypothetical protein
VLDFETIARSIGKEANQIGLPWHLKVNTHHVS